MSARTQSMLAILVAGSMLATASGQELPIETAAPINEFAIGDMSVGCSTGARSNTLLTLEVGPRFMTRSGPQRNTELGRLINFDTGEILSVTETNDLNYLWETGYEATLRWFNTPTSAWEVRWIGLDSFSAKLTVDTSDGNPIGTTTPISPFGFVLQEGAEQGGINARAHGYLQSLELGRHGVLVDNDSRTLTGFLGGRYIYFRDSIEAERAGDLDDETYGVAGNNNLLGFEAGLDHGEHYGFMTFGVKGRFGVFGNFARVNGKYDLSVTSGDFAPPQNLTISEQNLTEISTALDLGLYATIHCNQRFSLRFGYDFLLLTGLALGTEHLQPNMIVSTIDANGNTIVSPGLIDASARTNTMFHSLSVTGKIDW